MKDSREIIQKKIETVEIERPFEAPLSTSNNGYGGYRELNAPEGFRLADYWRAIRKRLWLVIGITVLLTTLAAIYMARKPDIFQANAVVQVDLEHNNEDLAINDRRSVSSSQDPSYFNTQLQLLTSETLLRRVVKDLNLDTNKEFLKAKSDGSVSGFRRLLKTIGLASDIPKKEVNGIDEVPLSANTTLASSEEIAEAARLAPYVDLIRKNFVVEPRREARATFKDTRLIDISYKNTNPEFAALVVNGIAEVFAKNNQERRSGTSSKTNVFLQERIAQLQSEIKAGENQLVDLAKKGGIITTEKGNTIATDSLTQLNKQLLDAENQRKDAEAKLNAVTKSPDSINSQVEELSKRYTTERENNIRERISQTQKNVDELTAEKNKLLEEYLPTAQEVREIDTKIQTLLRGMEKAARSNQEDLDYFRRRTAADLVNNLKTDYLSKKSLEEKISQSFNAQKNEAEGQNESGVSLKILQQNIETKKGFLENLNNKQRENDVAAVGTDNNISVADFATPPEFPVSPRRLTTVLAAMFLSTLFGMGLALFLEYLDDTIRTSEEVESFLQLPALAVIPTIDSTVKKRLLLVGANDEGETRGNTDLLIHMDSRSSLAEAYRQLRTSILLSTAGHAPKSLLITSSLPAEGKTTTAINTAISLAQTGAKVLVIDADMRRPRLHSIFNVSNSQGLSTLLSSELSNDDILSAVQYDADSKLNLLTSGPVPPNPAELIGSQQMAELMRLLQGKFTHVVVDSPPIASFTDGVLIASMVDGVILVVHSGKSSRQVVRRSRQLLQDIGAKIFGVVLNNVNLRSQDNSYYYQSYYHRDSYNQDEE